MARAVRDLPPNLQQGVGFGICIIKYRGLDKNKSSLCTIKWHAMQFYSDMACVNQGVG